MNYNMSSDNVLPGIFRISSANPYLPISDGDKMSDFIEAMGKQGDFSSRPNKTLKEIMRKISGKGGSNDIVNKAINYHADYYAKIISSLFTQEYYSILYNSNPTFQNLINRASQNKMQNMMKLNELTKLGENSTKSWGYDADELRALYYRMKENKEVQNRDLLDSNSTLMRQRHLNYDMYLRQLEWNQFLRLIAIVLALLIIVGYLADIEFDPDYIRFLLIAIFIIFVVNCVLLFMSKRRRHILMYPKLAFPGFPVLNRTIQKAHKDGTCNEDGSQMQC